MDNPIFLILSFLVYMYYRLTEAHRGTSGFSCSAGHSLHCLPDPIRPVAVLY